MLTKYLLCSIFLLTASSSYAECWVIDNLHGFGSYEYNQYAFKKDDYTKKVFVLNFDKKSPSVSDSLMNYSVITPTSMVGVYETDLGLTIQTWQISTDKTKALMTINRTNTHDLSQDAVSFFIGDVKAKCNN